MENNIRRIIFFLNYIAMSFTPLTVQSDLDFFHSMNRTLETLIFDIDRHCQTALGEDCARLFFHREKNEVSLHSWFFHL